MGSDKRRQKGSKISMKTVERTVTSDDGEKKKASFAECSECGYGLFLVFQIEGQSHLHLQCSCCGTSFCSIGECEKELKP